MRYFANILTTQKLEGLDFYNIVSNQDDLISGIPTLIIGWRLANGLYPDCNILDWHIKDKIYWTFGKRERREKMEKDLEAFKRITINNIIESVQYVFFNIMVEDKESKKAFYEELTDCVKKTIFVNNDMMYIYNDKENVVYGLSLRDIEYCF